MATEVDALLVRIDADLGDLKRELGKLKGETDKASQRFQNLGKIIAAALGGAAFAKVVSTVRTFEDLQATLKAVTGSADMAANSFALITKFTATTTFQLDEVTGAFITLKNAGIAPTSDVLTDVGNLAAALGKDIRDVAQAVFNATTGEMEMLKQMGIVAKLNGEEIIATYNGVTTTIDRNADSIVGYLRNISQENFSTAIEERSNTLSGAISNLEDNFSLFIMTIGDAGFKQSLTNLVKIFIDMMAGLKPLAVMIGKTLALAFDSLAAVIGFVVDNMRALLIAAGAFLSVQLATAAFSAAKGFVAMAKAVNVTAAAMATMNKLSKTNMIGLALAGTLAVAESTGALDDVLEAISGTMGEFFQVSGDTDKNLAELDAEIAKLARNTSNADDPTKGFTDSVKKMGESAEVARWMLAGYSQEVAKAMVGDKGVALIGKTPVFDTEEAEARFRGLLAAENDLLATQKKIDQRSLAEGMYKSLTPMQELEKKIYDVKEGFKLMGVETTDVAKNKLAELQTELKLMNPAFSGLVSAASSAADGVADAFAQMVMSGRFSLDGIKDIARQFIAQMIKMQLQLSIMNPILNNMFGLTGDNALATGGFNWSSIGLGAPSAGGGQMHPSVPRLVGERGPELFVPHSAGTLLNNANTGSALGGGTPVIVNQSLNFSLGVQDTVRAEVINLLPAINESAVSAVQEAKMRGGSFASTFGS